MKFSRKQKKERVFISVNLPVSAQKELQRLTEKLHKFHWPVKWGKTEKIHLTLAFIGSLPVSKLFLLQAAVEKGRAGMKSFEIGFKGLGSFPDFIYPRVVWVGLKGDLKSLAALQKSIIRELEKTGFRLDKKPFVPHMTIGRVKKGISRGALGDLGKKISKMRKIDFQNRILVKSVDIMKSELQRTGSVYTELAEIKL